MEECAGISVRQERGHWEGHSYLGRAQGLTGGCPGVVLHAWFREKRIRTVKQNSFTLRDVISPLCCSLLKAKSRLHRLNLVHAKKGPVLTLPHIPV